MNAVLIIGWTATVTGTVLGLPQMLRLLRTRNIEGVSVATWQVMLALNVAWTAHGIRIWQANMITGNILAFLSTAVIITVIAQVTRRTWIGVAWPGFAVAAGMMAVDQWLGPAVYGLVAAAPATVGQLTQSRELVTSDSVDGVSGVFLAVNLVNFGLWAYWGFLAGDQSAFIASTIAGTVALFNMVWYPLRLSGLRAFMVAPASES